MERSREIQESLNNFTRSAFRRTIDGPYCVTCGSDKVRRDDFKNELSRKEFGISHMCQKCQDDVFG